MRSAALSTIIAATSLTAVACSSTHTGPPSPVSSQATSSSAGPSSTAAATGKLTGLNACTLLADNETQQIASGAGAHLDEGELGGAGTSKCQWSKSEIGGRGGVTFSVVVRPAQSINDVVVKSSGRLSNTTSTGGRAVALVKGNEGEGSCLAAVAVGSGRIDINAVTNHGTNEQMCSVVSKIDDFVEPRLPS
ncbi:DUF3558 domain-containing protein [Amycolatopsis rhizosphaerae]|uniref:DUF3558 domain-containing protein n=1 Tax=Amycolatopsis rhizosphaerae TaxID=2053003 RepID=A0A558DME0_9PSEU|nr:DUF3558 family protein [Amycolatopsis rhizosphaerae]TVT62185.1 DUF3558 domain-containing protein [Amycolatopsis rhizosphaerae]